MLSAQIIALLKVSSSQMYNEFNFFAFNEERNEKKKKKTPYKHIKSENDCIFFR